jgi:drug/metabolite transporter (DMT)-like permease
MWFIYALIHVFLLALVNYTDEHLATNVKLPKNPSIHTRVGSVLLISTLMSFVGGFLIWLITKDTSLTIQSKNLAILSSIPMVTMYATYFYLLQTYPVHQVAPLFQISSIWLLIIELLYGGSITLIGLIGIIVLMYGAYILDAGTFKWKIPTKLLLIAIPTTSTWAIALYMVRVASENNSAIAITFWQMLTIGTIGVLLFLFVKVYREGFLYRLKKQKKVFLGLSLANETFAEAGYVFSNLAVAVAPVAAYVTAMSGVQSLFVLLLFLIFPQGKRAKVTKMQWIAVSLITFGVFLIERN